jgi:hypothetical protein
MTLAGVNDVKVGRTHRTQDAADRLDRRAREREIVPHLVDVPALAAEIDLHVDDDERCVLRAQIAVVGPGVGIGGYIAPARGASLVRHTCASPLLGLTVPGSARQTHHAFHGLLRVTGVDGLSRLLTLHSFPFIAFTPRQRSRSASPGAPARLRLGEQVATMMARVNT